MGLRTMLSRVRLPRPWAWFRHASTTPAGVGPAVATPQGPSAGPGSSGAALAEGNYASARSLPPGRKGWLHALLRPWSWGSARLGVPDVSSLIDDLLARGSQAGAARVWTNPLTQWIVLAFTMAMLTLVLTVPLDFEEQGLFLVFSIGAAFIVRRVQIDRVAVIAMIVISMTASLRYMFWRVSSTVGFTNTVDFFFGWGLVIAELYALTVLLLGYVQTAWPLRRQPVPLPEDSRTWPSVDVFIATYNEPLAVVKQTVFSAMSMDWPADKLNVYLLDDGRRAEFRDFADQAGCQYITRDNNLHAKAGNLNEALKVTNGEFVAFFDCDHIPTRSFLQLCMGWFIVDKKLAMLQTPHHFFSPDPFEKNLKTFRVVPNEGELFYGLVQDGNDLWNAAFFCGSCAIIRRGPLLEVGGVAIETVTEDAHTALKLSRLGYNTAYLAIPQAAGLATESLSSHIGQRIRWARGMGQIFRVDNPMLGKGLSFGQRLCYLNAMLHFFYGLPRLVFLTAPLAYLLFGAHVFDASAAMIFVYALPHIVLASLTNSRIQGRFRHSFWNEVYETVLAWYILRPVMWALINPKSGKFNVTVKGGLLREGFYDWQMAKPYLVLLAANAVGLVVGLIELVFRDGTSGTVLINLTWVVYNIIICSASADVANEARQVRATARVTSELPATLTLRNGRTVVCKTSDFSQHGVGLTLPKGVTVTVGDEVMVSIFRGNDEGVFPAKITSANRFVGAQFTDLTIAQQMKLAQVTFSRADNWSKTWGEGKPDSPWLAFREVTTIGLGNLVRIGTSLAFQMRTQWRDRIHARAAARQAVRESKRMAREQRRMARRGSPAGQVS